MINKEKVVTKRELDRTPRRAKAVKVVVEVDKEWLTDLLAHELDSLVPWDDYRTGLEIEYGSVKFRATRADPDE